MRTIQGIACSTIAFLTACGLSRAPGSRDAPGSAPSVDRAAASATASPQLAQPLGAYPLLFIENRGQLDPRVRFHTPGPDAVYFTSAGTTTYLVEAGSADTAGGAARQKLRSGLGLARAPEPKVSVLNLDFIGGNPRVQPIAREPRQTVVSYFRGPRERWMTGLHTSGAVVYPEVWPGIDVEVSGGGGRPRYTFTVKPGADPRAIRLAHRGASSLHVDPAGQLEGATPAGKLEGERPHAHQVLTDRSTGVDVRYALQPTDDASTDSEVTYVSFDVASYDAAETLTIGPVVLLYHMNVDSHLAFTRALGIAVDRAGSAYVCGETVEITPGGLPTTVGPDLTYNGGLRDAYVGKLDPTGTEFVYLGFIGGAGQDGAFAVAVDGDGAAYVAGYAGSDEATFPVVVGPTTHFQNGTLFGRGRGSDAFVAKVDPSGTRLLYSGYIGGTGDEAIEGIALDAAGNAFVTGFTTSDQASFPVSVGPDLTHNGGWDSFVAKVKADGNGLHYCGYIGGAGDDAGVSRDSLGNVSSVTGGGIAVDAAGAAYVTNFTASDEATFPNGQGFGSLGIPGADQTYNGGTYDAYVAKVKPDGTGLVYATYLGGAGEEAAWGMAVDAAGNAHVCGYTTSSEATFPATGGPDLHYHGGTDVGADAYVAKLSADGTTWLYAGYIGGPGDDAATNLRLDQAGNVYVVGETESTEADFPVVNGPGLHFGGVLDGFVAKLRAPPFDAIARNNFEYCGYLGAGGFDAAFDVAIDAAGDAYVCGDLANQREGFVVKVGRGLPGRDDFDYAPVITALPFTDTFPIGMMTVAPDDPVFPYPVMQTVWYHFTPSSDMVVAADHGCNTGLLRMFTGQRGALTEIPPLQPDPTLLGGITTFGVRAGVTYHFLMGITCSYAPCAAVGRRTFTLKPYVPAVNDELANATPITALPFETSVDMSMATRSPDDPGLGGVTVWYSLSPTRSLGVRTHASTEQPSSEIVVDALTRRGSSALEPVAGTKYCDEFNFVTEANRTYYLEVATSSCGLATAHLSVEEFVPAANDHRADAIAIRSLPFTDTLGLDRLTFTEDEHLFLFYAFPKAMYLNTPVGWYAFTPPRDTSVEASVTRGNVTVFNLARGTPEFVTYSYQGGSPLPARFTARGGVTYLLAIGDLCSSGTSALTVKEIVPPPNDDFDGATVITSLPFQQVETVTTASMTKEDAGGPSGIDFICGGTWNSVARSVWFAYTPSRSGWVEASTDGSDFGALRGAQLAAYTGSSLGRQQVACSVDAYDCSSTAASNHLRFYTEAGVTYHIMVGSFGAPDAPDRLVFSLSETSPLLSVTVDPQGSVNVDGSATVSGTYVALPGSSGTMGVTVVQPSGSFVTFRDNVGSANGVYSPYLLPYSDPTRFGTVDPRWDAPSCVALVGDGQPHPWRLTTVYESAQRLAAGIADVRVSARVDANDCRKSLDTVGDDPLAKGGAPWGVTFLNPR